MNNLTAVDEGSYVDEVVESHKPVLIKFWAPWCAPCKMLDPVIESIAEERRETLKVVTLNVDEAPVLAAQNGVRGLPTVTLYREGEKLESLSGVQPKESLDALLDRNIRG
ncbi:thioredoxin [Halomonas sp. KAO]|uniref:thioredoxin n=1 Tax=unclassified Halomonas TaxID=2609666 RepID=UPI00189ED311|nr:MULTISPECIES: thioredoxin [unclassified Halomonas]MBF7054576.1 thioredoxin [Halomonas sp. KAO]MDT0499989.1 thioredoxin [Halomonas sp. PAR7]MDT0512393.1 thioredoxin [Halomonas sp. LES1]MDT0591027.1 thioredoxin [Halomonas sp. PAR8]